MQIELILRDGKFVNRVYKYHHVDCLTEFMVVDPTVLDGLGISMTDYSLSRNIQ